MTFLYFLKSRYEKKYNKSQITLSIGEYFKIGLLVTILNTGITLIGNYYYFYYIRNLTIIQTIEKTCIFSILILIATIVLLLFYPHYKFTVEKKQVDEGLLYTISYMAILSKCGFSIDRIFSRAADIEQNKSIQKLINSYLTDIKIKGYDIEQALRNIILRSPSTKFSELISSILNANWTSGDLNEVLTYHFYNLENSLKDETENMINSLTVLSEVYVAMMVIAPIMLIIMFTLISVLNNGLNQSSTITILNSITFIFLPFVGTGFLVMLDTLRGNE
jgi:archaellum biogenesis protein FlaJ (TadC family)